MTHLSFQGSPEIIHLAVKMYASVALAGSATPVRAEEAPLCEISGPDDLSRIQEIFTGEWLIEHRAGCAMMGGMVLPFPSDGEV